MASPAPRRDRIEHAAHVSRLDKDLADFPKGYDTVVGERGITLSGGQKQRTAIARAVMTDPKILVLDDALSAVDTYTEEEILSRLAGVMRSRTTIIVSHRVSTVRTADQILVLDDGAIVERGTHDQLVAHNGLYAELYRKQLLEEELAASWHVVRLVERPNGQGRPTVLTDMSIHDEDVLGKAYDARLMRRLITYLRPYKSQVVLATAAIIGHSALELAPPYLVKLVIDRYIPARDIKGLSFIAALYLATLAGSFVLDYVQTWLLQLTGQRIMFDLRMQIYEHLQRLDLQFYDRNPVGRLMTRVTTDVDVLNDLFTSGVVSVFGDLFTLVGIMAMMIWIDWRARDRRVLRAAAHLAGHAVVPHGTCASRTGPCASGSRASTRTCRSASPAWRPCSCSGARRVISRNSTASTARTATPTSSRSSTTRCSIRRSS